MPTDLYIDSCVTIPQVDLSWTSVRASGPGGQNVNKVATKVQLRFDIAGTLSLNGRVKARLRRIAAGRFDASGAVVISSQLTRNRVRNLEDARDRLAQLIRLALIEPKIRRKTKPSRGAKRRRLEGKRRVSDKKKDRGWRPS